MLTVHENFIEMSSRMIEERPVEVRASVFHGTQSERRSELL
jgi:hypothetical protein